MGDTFLPFAGEKGMPWKECHVVNERLRFIARLLGGEKLARLYREFGISRKTRYKIYARYEDCGLCGSGSRSSASSRGTPSRTAATSGCI